PAPPQAQVAVVAPSPVRDETAVASESPSMVGARGRASAKEHEKFRAAAAVVDVDGIWLSNGDRVDLPGELHHVGDLVRVAHWLHLGTQVTKYLGASAQIWLGEALAVKLSLDGVEVPLLQGNPDHATLARRIGLLADSLGHPYHLSGSTTGLDLMMVLRWKDRETLFGPREPIPPAQMNVEADISWCRAPSTEEQDHRFVHAYDRSGSYLAGVSGLELGVGDPVHHPEGCPF